MRRGISLLEVLISMFVLLFGLMGVAAIFPVGNHYAGRGEQFDRGSALAEAGFAELKTREFLKPERIVYDAIGNALPAGWMYPDGRFVMTNGVFTEAFPPSNTDPGPGQAFVFDPLGAATATTNNFPAVASGNPWQAAIPPYLPPLSGQEWPIRRVTLAAIPGSTTKMNAAISSTIFRLHDDLTNELPKENDRPGIQRWTAVDANGTENDASDDTILARSYAGNYSYLATIAMASSPSLATEPMAALQPNDFNYNSAKLEVSVAVIYKRDLADERMLTAIAMSGSEFVFTGTEEALDEALEGIKPGNWIMLTGVDSTSRRLLLKWGKLLSIDDENDLSGPVAKRRAMLDMPEWPANPDSDPAKQFPVENLRAVFIPGVVSVVTQMLSMEQ